MAQTAVYPPFLVLKTGWSDYGPCSVCAMALRLQIIVNNGYTPDNRAPGISITKAIRLSSATQ